MREKIFNLPPAVLALTGIFIGIEALSQFLSPESNVRLLQNLAFVPGRFTFAFNPDAVSAVYNTLSKQDEFKAQAARFFLGDGEPLWWTPLTYAFLHGGWLHVGSNCLWFAAFGSAVARRFGTMRFLMFCAMAAIGGAAMHFVTHMYDLQPVIGASAIVSGAMAAAVRFVFQPGAPLGETLGFTEKYEGERAYLLPALSLADVFKNRSALSFLAIWFFANFILGAAVTPFGLSEGSIAWEAHIGGFLVGLLGFPYFDPKEPPEAKQIEPI